MMAYREHYGVDRLRQVRATHGVGRPAGIEAWRQWMRGDKRFVDTIAGFVKEVPGKLGQFLGMTWHGDGPPENLACGRPPMSVYEAAVSLHGSQRKAAAALGISLGKLQRTLRKELDTAQTIVSSPSLVHDLS